MPRWAPDTKARLRHAAFELFESHGYSATTIDAIAERAGVTRRTFHRWFPDKREVLFGGEEEIEQQVVSLLSDMSAADSLVDAITAAIVRVGNDVFDGRREELRLRNRIIATEPELAERDLQKSELLHRALASAFIGNGVAEPDADIAARVGVALFRATLHRWFGDENPTFAAAAREVRAAFDHVIAAPQVETPSRRSTSGHANSPDDQDRAATNRSWKTHS